MKNLVALLALLMLSQAQAQETQYYQEAQPQMVPVQTVTPAAPAKKRTVIFDERTNELVEVQPQVAEAQPVQPQQSYYPAYPAARPAIQEQPASVVQDSPLQFSAAEQRRKQRQDLEVKTEQKIVEKLEEARMEDEKKRADRLFNKGFGSNHNEQEAPAQAAPLAQPTYQPAPPPIQQVVVPAPIAAPVVKEKEEKVEEEKIDIKSEIRAAFEDSKPKKDPMSYFVSGQVGLGKYPDIDWIRDSASAGFSVGAITPERVVVEGAFQYGSYKVDKLNGYYLYNPYDMRQYNMSAALKYQLLPGRVRPSVGGLVSYTRRTSSVSGLGDFRTSDAFDVGLAAGLDVALTDVFSVGVDFRYLTNITYRDNTNTNSSQAWGNQYYGYTDENPIEKMDYYLGTLSGKLTF
jgi:hypothetical protein